MRARRRIAGWIVEPCEAALRPFYDRPSFVIAADRFADARLAPVQDASLRALPLPRVRSPPTS